MQLKVMDRINKIDMIIGKGLKSHNPVNPVNPV